MDATGNKDSVAHAELPPGFEEGIRAAYQALGKRLEIPDPAVCVRSSCIDEDKNATSFAGQHDTYLNVTGVDAVVDAVKKCRSSSQKESALFYREYHHLSKTQIKIAVVVQHLVAADFSAVAFSINPVTGDKNQILINANFGLGQSIVDGSVSPDTYIVDKADQTEVLEYRIQAKEMMTIPEAGGGVKIVGIPKLLRNKQALPDSHIIEIAAMVFKLEALKGYAVDIECAFKSDTLYLLQCRPITTLKSS